MKRNMSMKMMHPNTRSIARFEYLKTVKRVGFWLTTFLLPALFIVIGAVQVYSNQAAEQDTSAEALANESVALVDDAFFVGDYPLPSAIVERDDLDAAQASVRTGELNALIHLPNDFADTATYEIYAQDRGLTGNAAYSNLARDIIEGIVTERSPDMLTQAVLAGSLSADTTIYTQDGTEKEDINVSDFIVPGIAFVMFFLAVFMGAQYLLQSVAEEKENRVIESLLSVVSHKELINGKILGLSFVILTQIFIWIALVGVILTVGLTATGIASALPPLGSLFAGITILDALIPLACILLGFFFFASVMVGVGSIGTTQRDSQQLSAIFIIMAIFPLYFAALILSNPDAGIAQFFTYFPFTSALIIMIRHALDALPLYELILGLALNVGYVVLAFWIARKLFQLGMLMYNRKPKLREILGVFW